MANAPKWPRRKVISGRQSGPFWSNLYRVTLSCGHKDQVASGRNGQMPKTSGCVACYREKHMGEKIRNNDAVNEVISKVLKNPLPWIDYENDSNIVIDGTFTLAEIKSVIAAIESVPGPTI